MQSLRAAVVLGALAACSGAPDASDVADHMLGDLAGVDVMPIHADPQFAPLERAAIESATTAWRTFTDGRVDLRVTWDLDTSDGDAGLYRADASASFTAHRDHQRISWAPDNCAPNLHADLLACAMHEFGRVLGLRNLPDSHQVMSTDSPTSVFGTGDAEECRRVGVCRASN